MFAFLGAPSALLSPLTTGRGLPAHTFHRQNTINYFCRHLGSSTLCTNCFYRQIHGSLLFSRVSRRVIDLLGPSIMISPKDDKSDTIDLTESQEDSALVEQHALAKEEKEKEEAGRKKDPSDDPQDSSSVQQDAIWNEADYEANRVPWMNTAAAVMAPMRKKPGHDANADDTSLSRGSLARSLIARKKQRKED